MVAMFSLFVLIVAVFISHGEARLTAESIIGGIESNPHEFPYQISLRKNGVHQCGGGIIDKQFILTAAHCVIDDDDKFIDAKYTVVAGISHLNDNSSTRVEIPVVVAYVSDKYNGTSNKPIDDIAVLKLKNKFNTIKMSGLKLLELPRNTNQGLNDSNSFTNETATIAGFGWDKVEIKTVTTGVFGFTRVEEGSSSGKLLKAKTRILSNSNCEEFFYYPILESRLCANVIEHDKEVIQGVCNGDSGGPLVHDGKVVGIVSYNTIGCDDSKRPGVYTRVSAYVDMINNVKSGVITDDIVIHSY